MIEKPFNEILREKPQFRQSVNFFVKCYFRIRKIREMELDLGIPENQMKSNKLARLLSKWQARREQEMKNA